VTTGTDTPDGDDDELIDRLLDRIYMRARVALHGGVDRLRDVLHDRVDQIVDRLQRRRARRDNETTLRRDLQHDELKTRSHSKAPKQLAALVALIDGEHVDPEHAASGRAKQVEQLTRPVARALKTKGFIDADGDGYWITQAGIEAVDRDAV
jgi:uncharacterized protein YjhX (UPF0386 family)